MICYGYDWVLLGWPSHDGDIWLCPLPTRLYYVLLVYMSQLHGLHKFFPLTFWSGCILWCLECDGDITIYRQANVNVSLPPRSVFWRPTLAGKSPLTVDSCARRRLELQSFAKFCRWLREDLCSSGLRPEDAQLGIHSAGVLNGYSVNSEFWIRISMNSESWILKEAEWGET